MIPNRNFGWAFPFQPSIQTFFHIELAGKKNVPMNLSWNSLKRRAQGDEGDGAWAYQRSFSFSLYLQRVGNAPQCKRHQAYAVIANLAPANDLLTYDLPSRRNLNFPERRGNGVSVITAGDANSRLQLCDFSFFLWSLASCGWINHFTTHIPTQVFMLTSV